MKYFWEGDWLVSTPIYAGTKEQMHRSLGCSHPEFTKSGPQPMDPPEGFCEVISERCTTCNAVRMKMKPEAGQDGSN